MSASGTYVERVPHAGLRGGVESIVGFHEVSPAPLGRREIAQASVTLILNLGPPLRVGGRDERLAPRGSFIAPMNGHWGLTEFEGESEGIQVDLDPVFARRLLGVPLAELDRVVVPLDDVTGSWGEALVDRLGSAPDWRERMDLLEEALLRRAADSAASPPDVVRAWSRLRASDGGLSVGDLTDELGCSSRHLSARFRDHVGAGPKASARIMRFRRAVRLLGADDGSRFAEIAAGCGYADQPHMNRDFRELAGISPGRLVGSRMREVPGYAHRS